MGNVENGLYTMRVSSGNVEAVFIPEEIQNFQYINKRTKARRDQRERYRLDAARREEEAAQRKAKTCRKHARAVRQLMKWELGLLAVALINYLGISFSWVAPGFGVAVIVCCLVAMSFLAGRFKGAGYRHQ